MKEKFPNTAVLLRNVRIKNGMSQAELGRKLGYSVPQFISNVERGKCGLPIKQQVILHTELGCPLEDLYKASLEDFKHTYFKKVELFKEGASENLKDKQ